MSTTILIYFDAILHSSLLVIHHISKRRYHEISKCPAGCVTYTTSNKTSNPTQARGTGTIPRLQGYWGDNSHQTLDTINPASATRTPPPPPPPNSNRVHALLRQSTTINSSQNHQVFDQFPFLKLKKNSLPVFCKKITTQNTSSSFYYNYVPEFCPHKVHVALFNQSSCHLFGKYI